MRGMNTLPRKTKTRIHNSLRVTPAMEAGVTDRLWEISDIVDLIEAAAPKPGPARPIQEARREIRYFKLTHYPGRGRVSNSNSYYLTKQTLRTARERK